MVWLWLGLAWLGSVWLGSVWLGVGDGWAILAYDEAPRTHVSTDQPRRQPRRRHPRRVRGRTELF